MERVRCWGAPTLGDLRESIATAPVLFAAEAIPGALRDLIGRRFKQEGDVDQAACVGSSGRRASTDKHVGGQHAAEALRRRLTRCRRRTRARGRAGRSSSADARLKERARVAVRTNEIAERMKCVRRLTRAPHRIRSCASSVEIHPAAPAAASESLVNAAQQGVGAFSLLPSLVHLPPPSRSAFFFATPPSSLPPCPGPRGATRVPCVSSVVSCVPCVSRASSWRLSRSPTASSSSRSRASPRGPTRARALQAVHFLRAVLFTARRRNPAGIASSTSTSIELAASSSEAVMPRVAARWRRSAGPRPRLLGASARARETSPAPTPPAPPPPLRIRARR